MKKKIHIILAVLGILLPSVLGFALGYSSGVATNDDSRIKKELGKVNLEEPIRLKQVARGSDGKVEQKVIEEYLEKYQEQVSVLIKCSEELKEAAESGEKPEVERIKLLRESNDAAYQEMRRLAEKPEDYILERIRVYGTEYETWSDDWAETLRVAQCKEKFDGKYSRLYEENKTYLDMAEEKFFSISGVDCL